MPKNISTDSGSGLRTPFSAFCVGAPHSGCGKTTLTLALLRALKGRGLKVQPFKCGPDYIDTAFHTQAAACQSINLDTWMMAEKGVLDSFARACGGEAEVAVLEGVMGLFDGFAPDSLVGSSADCVRLLKLPVILIVDAKGMAGSIAPLVKGFCEFNPGVEIRAVIANNVGSKSHTEILAGALSHAGLPPLLGGLPKNTEWRLEERHLGLTPFSENKKSAVWFESLAAAVEEFIDIDRLLEITAIERPPEVQKFPPIPSPPIRLALARDAAFNFYYRDNLTFLQQAGFEIVEFSPLADKSLPDNVKLIMLGGGFPEMFAAELAANRGMRAQIKAFAEQRGMIYAECGGFMYLGETLENSSGESFPMCSVVPGRARMTPGLRSLGYREVSTIDETCFGPPGTEMRGHEFHWSEMELNHPCPPLYRQKNRRGESKLCGVRIENVFASYIHTHFSSAPQVLDAWYQKLAD